MTVRDANRALLEPGAHAARYLARASYLSEDPPPGGSERRAAT